MSIQTILTGVTAAATTVAARVAEAAEIQLQADPSAIGRAYRVYDDTYARLKIYDIGDARTSGSYVAVPSSTFSSVAVNSAVTPRTDTVVPVTEIDYFLLSSLSEVYVERMAPTYTFGSATMYTAGQDAQQFVYSGSVLINPLDGDSGARFRQTYEYLLRSSRLVTKGRHRYVELYYRDQIRRGYITSLTAQTNSQFLNKIDVTFTMFVIDSRYIPD